MKSKSHLIFAAGVAASAFCLLPVLAHADTPSQPMAAHDAAPAPMNVQSSGVRTYSEAELADAEKTATTGTVADDQIHLSFTTPEVRLVVRTGPDDDMLSYRVAGLRNPVIRVPANATLRLLFVNTDEDMLHDIHFSTQRPPFPTAPDITRAPGTAKLPHEADEHYSGEELVVRVPASGAFTYFCSVRGHAKGGMFGTLLVGDTPEPAAPPTPPPGAHPHEGMPAMPAMPGMTGDHDAQAHAGHDMGTSHSLPGANNDMAGMSHDNGAMMMRSATDLTDPMSREASGTAWVPESSPMYARMRMHGDRMLMLHGMAYPRYTHTGSDRDVSSAGQGRRNKVDAPNMGMVMYSRPLGVNAQLGLRGMLSLDPITEQGFGYPLLYQSGEEYRGESLHDRQHPHDLVAELSATYSRRLRNGNSAYLYVGYPGEPALGPSTFMHRLSAMDNPDAPISHHWQDSTHITFGVATLGYNFGRFKIEGSAFKGEEPNSNRYDFDSPRLDSFSARLSWNPTSNLALQVSAGRLRRPEPAEPDISSRVRTTASIIYNRPMGRDSNWANTFVFGRNNDSGDNPSSNAFLFETALQRGVNTVYGRLERVQKSGDELSLPATFDENQLNDVSSYAVGYVRDLRRNRGIDIGVGAQLTFGTNPSSLDDLYGGRSHTGFQVFLRLRPSRLRMDDTMSSMSGMHNTEGMEGQATGQPAANGENTMPGMSH